MKRNNKISFLLQKNNIIFFLLQRNNKISLLFLRNLFISTFLLSCLSSSVYSQDKQKYKENSKYTQTLLYQNKEGDFLVFYDPKGIPHYLRYRIDRWDYDNEQKVSLLRRGTEYQVTWLFITYKPEKFTNSDQTMIIRKVEKTPAGKYLKHANIMHNKIIY